MDTHNDLTIEPGEGRTTFTVDDGTYPLEAIQGAAFLFVDRCYVWLDRLASGRVQVVLKARRDADPDSLVDLAGSFANELLNQALRLRIGESNARIREFVMAKAFFAVDRRGTLDRLLAELDAEDAGEPLDIPVPWETKVGS